jgi:hypothetical protein
MFHCGHREVAKYSLSSSFHLNDDLMRDLLCRSAVCLIAVGIFHTLEDAVCPICLLSYQSRAALEGEITARCLIECNVYV